MAKKKDSNTGADTTKPLVEEVDLELLTHKYADYYVDSKRINKDADSEDSFNAIRKIDEEEDEEENYIWYDTKYVYCPVYSTKVDYEVIVEQELHPIIISLLEIIKYLSSLKEKNNEETLQKITQLDIEILGSILSDLVTKGLVGREPLRLTTKGKEILAKRKEAIPQKKIAYIVLDGIFGEVVADDSGVFVAENHRDIMLETNAPDSKDCIELKPSSKDLRPRIEYLSKEWSENKTLRSVIHRSAKWVRYNRNCSKATR